MTSGQRPLGRMVVWIVESSLRGWVLCFAVGVVVFGGFYASLSSYGHGISDTATEIDFWDGLYFSVVTVSSLGYGDLHPQGYAKIAAGIEVLMGLAFIGVMIAKLTSKPISYLVSRLFVSEVKRELRNIGTSLGNCVSELSNLIEANNVHHPTPGTSSDDDQLPPDPRKLATEWADCLRHLSRDIMRLQQYIEEERLDSSYFLVVPTASMVEVADEVSSAIDALGQAVVGLPADSSIANRILTFGNRRSISNLIAKTDRLARVIKTAPRFEKDVKEAYEDIIRACSDLADALKVERLYPDQIMSDSNGK